LGGAAADNQNLPLQPFRPSSYTEHISPISLTDGTAKIKFAVPPAC
jgi:hypothetical protein